MPPEGRGNKLHDFPRPIFFFNYLLLLRKQNRLDALSVLHTYCKYILIEARFKKCLPFPPARGVYKFPPPLESGRPPSRAPLPFCSA